MMGFVILLLLAIILLLIGIYNTYTFWWDSSIDKSEIRIIISFFSLGGSALIFSYILTCTFFVPKNIRFSFLTLAYKGNFLIIAKEIGEKKVRKIILKNMIAYFIIFILFGLTLLISLNEFEKYELSHFGIKQEIGIKEIATNLKGFEIANIEYEHNLQHYTKQLYLNSYKKGEKHLIIFSKNNPNIMIWYDEFNSSFKLY